MKGTSFVMRNKILPVIIIIIGVLIFMYPTVTTIYNDYHQRRTLEAYATHIDSVPETVLSEKIQQAHIYNTNRSTYGPYDPWSSRVPENDPRYQEYLNTLSGHDVMSQVVIPKIGVALPVYHGTDTKTLSRGVGHLFGTDLPVGGVGTHAVLTGHTGLQTSTMFDRLVDVGVGDVVYLDTFGQKLKYEVFDVEVVLPHETDSLKRVDGKDLVTLVTCTPYGVNSHRLLVHAYRVPFDGDDSVFEVDAFVVYWWMWLCVFVVVVVVAYVACMFRRRDKVQVRSVNRFELAEQLNKN